MGDSVVVHLGYVICGAALFSSVYFITRWLANLYIPDSSSEGNRSGYNAAIVAEKSVSVVVGTICGGVGFYIVLELYDDIVYGRSQVLLKSACFVYFYFIQDLVTMFLSFRLSRECQKDGLLLSLIAQFICHKPLMITHHLLFITLLFPFSEGSMRNHFGDWYVGCLFIMELSTPVLSIHYILECVGLKDSLIQQINGLFFIAVFFIVRIFTFPCMYWMYAYRYHDGNIVSAVLEMYWFCHASTCAFFLMQLFWFIAAIKKVLRGVGRIYKKHV